MTPRYRIWFVLLIGVFAAARSASDATADTLTVYAGAQESAYVLLSGYSPAEWESPYLRVQRGGTSVTRSYVKFKMPAAPAGKVLQSVELVVWVLERWPVDAPDPLVSASYQQGIDLRLMLGHSAPSPQTSFIPPSGGSGSPLVWDVTTMVNSLFLGQEVLFLFDPSDGAPDHEVVLASARYEGAAKLTPRLALEYVDANVPNIASSFSKIKSLYQ